MMAMEKIPNPVEVGGTSSSSLVLKTWETQRYFEIHCDKLQHNAVTSILLVVVLCAQS